jgi:hypothetical protein
MMPLSKDCSGWIAQAHGEWYVGRPVMVTRNDYATGVFNGDIGLTLPDPARPERCACTSRKAKRCAACLPQG